VVENYVNVPYHYLIDALCILFIYTESIKLVKVESDMLCVLSVWN